MHKRLCDSLREQNFADDLEEIVFVSDLDTNELLFLNRKGRERLGLENYRGKKCYEVFQGKNEVCEFCGDRKLREEKCCIWTHENTHTNRYYILIDKLIPWGNRLVKMELAFDMTDKKKISESVELIFETTMMECITDLTRYETFSKGIAIVLSKICNYYEGSRAYILELSEGKHSGNCYIWDQEKQDVIDSCSISLGETALQSWMHLFSRSENLVIQNVEELKYIDFEAYIAMKKQNIRNILAVPIIISNKLTGVLVVDNPTVYLRNDTFLETILFFIAMEMKQDHLERQLSLLSYYDDLTGLPNKLFLEKKISISSNYPLQNLGVLYADVNDLKKINETVGYQAGDFFLISVGDILKRYFGRHAVYRVEGDEFVVLCPDIPYHDFMKKVNEINNVVKEADENSVSTGYAWVENSSDICTMIHNAKRIMYLEKQICYKNHFSHRMYQISLEKMQKEKRQLQKRSTGKNDISLWDDDVYQKRLLEYDLMVRQCYDEIFEMNLSQNKIRRIFHTTGDFLLERNKATIHDVLQKEKELVYPEDIQIFLDIFSRSGLEHCLCGSKDHFYVEYRRRNIHGTYDWIAILGQRMIYPRTLSHNEDVIFLIAFKNIQKKVVEQEQLRMTEKKNYLAMIKSCDFICDVDVKEKEYSLILNEDLDLTDFPLEGDYQTHHHWMVEHYIHPEDREKWNANFDLNGMIQKFESGQKEVAAVCRMKQKNGRYIWRNVVAIFIDGNDVWQDSILIIGRNVQGQKEEEQTNLDHHLLQQEMVFQKEISHKEDLYRIVVEQTGIGVSEWIKKQDATSSKVIEKSLFVSKEVAHEFGFYEDNMGFFDFLLKDNRIHKEDKKKFFDFLNLEDTNYCEITCRITKDRTSFLWYKFTLHRISNEEEQRIVGTMLDVDQEKKATDLFKLKAELDGLTGIANQETFYFNAKQSMDQFPNKKYAVMIMDIDKFKVINDLYTMSSGNRALVQIAHVIQSCIGENDLCARIYADVFYILAEYEQEQDILNLVDSIAQGIYGLEHGSMLRPCFGIIKRGDCEDSITLLCELAGFAHKYGKGKPSTIWTFYNSMIREEVIEEKQLESEMEFALKCGQFKVYLQPQYIIGTSEVVGAEALVRWKHPEKGMVFPGAFIPLFEKNEFILKLDEYIWERVCMLLKRWKELGFKQIPIAVNMSRVHLKSANLKDILIHILNKYDIPKSNFELELTESLLFEDLDNVILILEGLRKEGFTLNMDDFGSGYSSLNMLRNIPIDVLKIDRNFFDEKFLTPRGKIIVKYVVTMAKELNMRIVAEGVETAAQENFLKDIGCDVAQGYYFSKPIPIEEFERKFCYKK